MFWKKKHNCPIEIEDKEWIEDSFLWIKKEFGENVFLKNAMVLPTKEFFDGQFQSSAEDAFYLFKKVGELLGMNLKNFNFNIYKEDPPIEFSEGLITMYDQDTALTSGKYVQDEYGNVEISVEENQLKDPIGLIATIAHEFAHFMLLGENRIKENDEPLTDLLTIAMGFGIFTGNTSLSKLSTWSGSVYSGWKIEGGAGYLHYKLISYALALLSIYRDEDNPSWADYLEKTVRKEFFKSVNYITQNKDQIKFTK